jgi:uncharacterized membrane protein (DUF485 family)
MKLLPAILAGALLAGVLDLAYAYTHFMVLLHREPLGIVQGIASGLIGGKAASDGGVATAALGVALEFVLTLIMAAVYIIPSQWIADLRRYWWVFGPCYGVIVMMVMYYVVLPLSAAHGNGYLPDGAVAVANCRVTNGMLSIGSCTGADRQLFWGTVFAHTVMVGLPIAGVARWFLGSGAKASL